jgi:hypothetical protein
MIVARRYTVTRELGKQTAAIILKANKSKVENFLSGLDQVLGKPRYDTKSIKLITRGVLHWFFSRLKQ